MNYFTKLVAVALLVGGFCLGRAAEVKWPEAKFYASISTDGSFYDFQGEYVIYGNELSVMDYLTQDGKGGRKVLFSRTLTASELKRVTQLVRSNQNLANLGKAVWPPEDPAGSVGIDPMHRLFRFRLARDAFEKSADFKILYWGHVPGYVRSVIKELNRLVPAPYQFLTDP